MYPEWTTFLLVDSDIKNLERLTSFLQSDSNRVIAVTRGRHALNCLEREEVALAFIHSELEDMDGLELLSVVRKEFSKVGVIVIADKDSEKTRLKAYRTGALDFIVKPIYPEKIESVLIKAQAQLTLINENINLHHLLDKKYGIQNIVGNSPKMQFLQRQIYQVAPSQSNVLLLGESGVGKELVSHAIHQLSPRKDKPFVRVDCGALADNLVESELFGHEKGAYTSADSRRIGRFELADGGTIFIDEISELPLQTQVKFLRILENHEFERLGSTKTIRVDVRVIAASNIDLKEAVENKLFRKDLFYRLSVINLKLPPLRERIEDIPLLVNTFIKQFAAQDRTKPIKLSRDTLRILCRYAWPGNVRELKNLIEGLAVMRPGETITPEDLPTTFAIDEMKHHDYSIKPGMTLKDVEKLLIQITLSANNGHRAKTADMLGIGLRTLFRKIKDYELE